MNSENTSPLNKKLEALWKEHFKSDYTELHPVYFQPINPTSLAFVGINPSFSTKGISKIIKDTKHEGIDINRYFQLSNDSFEVEISNQIDTLSREKYPTFFKQHHALSKALGVKWDHFDMFQYRHTKQNKFVSKVLNRDKTLNKFGQAQFDLFYLALEKASPKLIIIANAQASRIFQANKDLKFSTQIGTYLLNLGGKSVPVFLSGMLTGGRALDVFSRERLFWHVESVYKASLE